MASEQAESSSEGSHDLPLSTTSQHTTAEAAQIFELFGELPTELQDMVTEQSIDIPQVMRVWMLDEQEADCHKQDCKNHCAKTYFEIADDDPERTTVQQDGNVLPMDLSLKLLFARERGAGAQSLVTRNMRKVAMRLLPAILPVHMEFGEEIRYDPARTAVFPVNLDMLLHQAAGFRIETEPDWPLLCVNSHKGQGIFRFVVHGNDFADVYEEPIIRLWLEYPWVNLFAKGFPDVKDVLVLIQKDDMHVCIEDIQAPAAAGYKVYSNSQKISAEDAKAYCAMTEEEHFEAETEGIQDEDPHEGPNSESTSNRLTATPVTDSTILLP